MMVHPRGTSATSGLEITAELIVIDLIAIGRCGTVSASSFFGTVSSFGCAWDFVCSSRVFLSTVLAQDPGREPHDWMIRIYHHTSQLRANSERAPLNSPSVSGHRLLRVSPGFSYLSLGRCCCCRRRVSCFVCSSAQTPLSGAAPLFSSAPALLFRCAWKRRWCVSPAAGGTKSPPGPRCCEYRTIVGFVVFVVDRNKQGRCFTRASPPVASARVRSRPLASARLRSPPLASGHLRSTSLAKHILDGPVVGSGGAWVGLGGPWGIVSAHKRVLGVK
jgi:hypothetical protein